MKKANTDQCIPEIIPLLYTIKLNPTKLISNAGRRNVTVTVGVELFELLVILHYYDYRFPTVSIRASNSVSSCFEVTGHF